MDIKTYGIIQRFCNRFLTKSLHGRHIEDLVQYVAMKHFESEGKKNWLWACCDYCRENGLSVKRGKMGARTIESSISIDAPSRDEENNRSEYLLDEESILRSKQDDHRLNYEDNFKGILEDFLTPLQLDNEVLKWTIKNYKVKTNLK